MDSATQPPAPRLIAAAQAAGGLLATLAPYVTRVLAPNPGPMTLDGTNTWVLRAAAELPCVIVDPGPNDEAHLSALARFAPVAAILLTHNHPDHIEGVERLVELLGPVEVVWPGQRVPAALAVGTGLAIRAVATPGHTSDSRCFLVAPAEATRIELSQDGVILTGDTILGRGTTMVAYPDGELGPYLASLRRLRTLSGVAVLPGHGPALVDCGQAADYYLDHRLARLAQVEAAHRQGARTPAEVVAVVYADVDPALWPAAQLSIQAQLSYLESQQDDVAPEQP